MEFGIIKDEKMEDFNNFKVYIFFFLMIMLFNVFQWLCNYINLNFVNWYLNEDFVFVIFCMEDCYVMFQK